MEECGVICRHIICVAKADRRFEHILRQPIDDIWLNSVFIDTFQNFQVLMPSQAEVAECAGDMFPGVFMIPQRVAQRGRPRIKRLKGQGEQQFKKKVQTMTGNGIDDKRRQCSICRCVGHRKNGCPLRARFKLQ